LLDNKCSIITSILHNNEYHFYRKGKIMGMPCEINSILKLKPSQGYPEELQPGSKHQASKEGYRIIPVDVPIP
jgi:hypothetical protein